MPNSLKTQQRNNGFTLIEVIIALVILVIALTAVIQAVDDNAVNVTRLKNRDTAHWVGLNTIASMQAGLLAIPSKTSTEQGQTVMLNKTWYWATGIDDASDPYVLRVYVDVRANKQANPLSHLIGFISVRPTT